MRHEVKTEVDSRELTTKSVKLVHFSTPNMSSEFWRVYVHNHAKNRGMSISFDSEQLARMVFNSHVDF